MTIYDDGEQSWMIVSRQQLHEDPEGVVTELGRHVDVWSAGQALKVLNDAVALTR